MPTIAAAVFDVVTAFPGCGCSMRDVIKALPDIDRERVISAMHRLREMGVLRIHHELAAGSIYNLMPGATRPTDGRGRPSKPEQTTHRLESSPATPRSETPG